MGLLSDKKNCQLFVAKLRNFFHSHNRMKFYQPHSVSLFPDFGVSIDDGLLINVSDTFDVSDIISILGGKKTGMTGFYWLGITEKRYLLNSF